MVTVPRMARAAHPPADLPGLPSEFSRILRAPGRGVDAGLQREWHYLDTDAALESLGLSPVGTVLAVHGNPTWSYLWRSLLTASIRAAEAGAAPWRVIAVDQLEMGFSERTGVHRPLAQRVEDLAGFTAALGLRGPVVSLGHDWGGVVSLGWAVEHATELAGIMLLNTAIHHPDGTPIPAPLRLAGLRGVLAGSTRHTTAFLDTTLALARPALDPSVKSAYRAPYRDSARRAGIAGFVADIPADSRHSSRAALDAIAARVAQLKVPALLLWGPQDPIFTDRYLDDLCDRLPHADVHRFEGAGHLVAEDRPYADAILRWLAEHRTPLLAPATSAPGDGTADQSAAADRPLAVVASDADYRPLWDRLEQLRDDDSAAVIDMGRNGRAARRVSWRRLDDRVRRIAAGLTRIGVRKGDRISLLVPPGPTLTAVLYACLRIGAVVVVADAGLGIRGLTRAVRGSWPDVIIGEVPGLLAARALGWPGIRISAVRLPKAARAALGISYSLREIADRGADRTLPAPPEPDDAAAVLFTSGSTGAAKGVVYRHRQLSALRDTLAAHFEVTAESGLVTGFAPFALLGPALGTLSVTPDMDVSSPRTLTARAVAAAVREASGRIVFLSPAAILNVVATADELSADDREALRGVHTFLSTGAPVGPELLAAAAELMPNATPHTPYGMTECLLVTDITLAGIRAAAAEPDPGVCVGTPIGRNRVLISGLDAAGDATGAPSAEPGVLGEIVVSAPHLKDHYDRLWLTDRASLRETGSETDGGADRWHRTGDVGHLDDQGRLWVEGRLPHVLVTDSGPLAPVGAEQEIERLAEVRRAALVGVGPCGLQQAVAVVEAGSARPGLASPDLSAAVRARTSQPLAAVLSVPRLPTDIRHNSKIDRTRLSEWAERLLAGERPAAP